MHLEVEVTGAAMEAQPEAQSEPTPEPMLVPVPVPVPVLVPGPKPEPEPEPEPELEPKPTPEPEPEPEPEEEKSATGAVDTPHRAIKHMAVEVSLERGSMWHVQRKRGVTDGWDDGVLRLTEDRMEFTPAAAEGDESKTNTMLYSNLNVRPLPSSCQSSTMIHSSLPVYQNVASRLPCTAVIGVAAALAKRSTIT